MMNEKEKQLFNFCDFANNLKLKEINELLNDENVSIKNCKDLDTNLTALHYAAQNANNSDTIKLLIENNAEVNKQNIWGWTPLHLATQKGYTSNVETLLEYGANAAIASTKEFFLYGESYPANYTVLDCAKQYNHSEIETLLINNNKKKVTPEQLLKSKSAEELKKKKTH